MVADSVGEVESMGENKYLEIAFVNSTRQPNHY